MNIITNTENERSPEGTLLLFFLFVI